MAGGAKRLAAPLVLVLLAAAAEAAELKPETVAAFERYQRAAESAMATDLATSDRFLRILTVAPGKRRDIEDQIRRGLVAVEGVEATENGQEIDIPDGLVHHWVGTVFMPGVHVDAAVALMQDYNDRHSEFFRPNVVRSKALENDGDRYLVFLRFYFKKVIAVTVDTESTAVFTRGGPDCVSSSLRSTRVTEIDNPDTPEERALPVGNDSGYLWRLNTYWRFLERDGGTYVECESVSLTRGIPIAFGWIIRPFVTSIPRETLTKTLEGVRRLLTHE